MPEPVDLAKLVDIYVQLRDKKSAIKKEADKKIAEIQAGLEKIEAVFRGKLDESNVESMNTASGTFFKKLSESVTVASRETFYDWAKSRGQEDLLDIRAAKANILAYKEAHGDLPPGLNYSAEIEVQIRRK